ncbi:TPA: hypothetical protein ACH3X1_010925 [Trebouxia sp. C0004]
MGKSLRVPVWSAWDLGSFPILSGTDIIDDKQLQGHDAQMHSGSSHVLSGIKGSFGRRLLDAGMSASSTAAGTHSASGNLTAATSYRAGPNAAGIGVALTDGASAARTAGLSSGTGRNASANQGLTAVTTTTNKTANSNVIHNSAASGSSAADLSSSSAAQSQTGTSKDRQTSNSSTAGDVSAMGKAANVVSDSSEASTTATPEHVYRNTALQQVTASQATNATANQASKYIAEDITADQAAFNHGHATVRSTTSGDKVAGSIQGAGTEHAELAFTG